MTGFHLVVFAFIVSLFVLINFDKAKTHTEPMRLMVIAIVVLLLLAIARFQHFL
jgi:hypothetical protein